MTSDDGHCPRCMCRIILLVMCAFISSTDRIPATSTLSSRNCRTLRLRGAGKSAQRLVSLKEFTAVVTKAALHSNDAQMSQSLKALLDCSLEASMALSAQVEGKAKDVTENFPTSTQALLTCNRCWSLLLRPGNVCCFNAYCSPLCSTF